MPRAKLWIKNFQKIAFAAAMIVLFFLGGLELWRIQEAQAAAPTYIGAGTPSAGRGNISVSWPSGVYQADDIGLLIIETANEAVTLGANAADWTELASSPQGTGTAGGTVATSLTVFWSRATSGSMGNVGINDSGDHQRGRIFVFRGVVATGSPIDVTYGDVLASASTAVSISGGTTTVDDTLVIAIVANGTDTNTAQCGGTWTNASLANLVEIAGDNTNQGNGGGICVAAGEKTTAGAFNVTTTTLATSSVQGRISVSLKPPPITTLATGTDAATVTVAPGSGIRDDGSFTFRTSAGTDSITALTVILAASGTPYNGLSEVRITNDAGTTTYFSAISSPSSNTLNFSGGTPIPVTASQTQFKIRVTPKTHALMAAPPGAEYNLSPYVSVFSSTNAQVGSDSNANTLTIDNLSPNNATSTSGSAGNAQVTLNWTTSSSSDFNRSVVLRWAASTPGSEVPAEGTEYGVDNGIGAATVACARNDAASTAVSGVDGAGTGGCSATALTNGQAYSYKIFQKDSRYNYDVGVTLSGSPFTPQPPANPVPTTTSIDPTGKTVGDPGFTLTVNGTNFVSSSVVKFDGSNRTTTYVSSTQLTATIPASDLTSEGTFPITVFNPTPGGGESNSQTFTVSAAPNPVPTTTSIDPTSKNAGDPEFTLTVNGTNFVAGSVVKFDGSSRTTTYVSSIQLTATIPASDLATGGTFSITVFNSAPGGGTSNAQTFTVNNLVPTTTSISPTSKNVYDSGFTLTVNGTNFVSTSVVKFDGSNRTTTYVSSTQLTAAIPASDLTAAGNFSITVLNPTPGGGTSNAQTFTVNNPVPTTTSIDPTGKTVGDPGFTLTVSGTLFISSSVVRFNGSDRTTTFVNSTTLTATIPASDLTAEGTFPITVFNPTPGGGESNSQTFTVSVTPPTPNPVPTLTSISPSSATQGDPGLTMTLTGTDFVSTSVARFNSTSRTTTFVNSTTLTASIPASDLTVAGNFPVTVFTPSPGGGASNSKTFTIAPAPSAEPAPTVGGGTPTTVIFSGRAFPRAKLLVVDKDIHYERTVSQDTVTNDEGYFYTSFVGIFRALHSFGLVVKDKEGRASQTKFFNIDTLREDFVVKDLIIPPTIGFIGSSVTRGGMAVVIGYASPKSSVAVELNGIIIKKDALAGPDGAYKVEINTGPLEFGLHKVRVKQALSDGKGESDYSPAKNFIVSRVLFPKADFNNDGGVDIRDWSIFLFHWGSKDMEKRMKIDLNNDGKIDISDFSIFVRNIRKK